MAKRWYGILCWTICGLIWAQTGQAQSLAQLQQALDAGDLATVKTWLDSQGKARLSPEQRYVRGQYLFKSGQAKAAVDDLEAAAKASPDNPDLWLSVAEAAGEAAGDAGILSAGALVKTIRRALDRVVAIEPDNIDAREGLIQFHTQVPWIMGGRTKQAYLQAEAIARLDPVLGKIWKANIDLSEGDEDAAEAVLRAVLAEDPLQENAAVSLAALLQNKERWDEAVEHLSPLTKTDPPSLIALYQLGRVGALSGEFLEAAEAGMRRYLSLAAEDDSPPVPLSPANWRLGMILRHSGQLADARAAFEQALILDPDNDEARAALKALPEA